MIETNSLNRALRAYLSQYYKKKFYPIIFYLRKLSAAKLNYNIYNKELFVTADRDARRSDGSDKDEAG